MPASQVNNPKGTVKRTTTNDLPYSPIQPVISKYTATSTASQTIINLNFSVDQSLTDQFLLFVDGKLLTLGSTNDFTFTAIASDNTSTQVTLNASIPANLNILAYKLGLKKESEFLTDNRFTQLYANMGAGFQGFVSTTDNVIAPTTTTGTPVAGTFYSTITGRASMADLSQDLKARIGVERIITQQIQLIPNEQGPTGQQVYGVTNDPFGKIRCVGNWQSLVQAAAGSFIDETSGSGYLEVTFYGTGLNLLTDFDGGARSVQSRVDGGTLSANIYPSGTNTVIGNRNYNPYCVLQVVNGLALGVHTVTIQNGNGAVTDMIIQGLEILNESTSVKVNPGIGYIKGQKNTLSAQASFLYNSAVTGTRGGRVLVYQTAAGAVASAFNAAGSQLNLTSANHSNEEVARNHYWREFGAGRSDDFSTLTTSSTSRGFFIDDDTTGLNASLVIQNTTTDDGLVIQNGGFIDVNFLGTGLDILRADTATGTLDTHTVTVDGTSVGNLSTTASANTRWTTIVSGLQYGSHTVRIARTTTGNQAAVLRQFAVYQPKKPTLPSGALELADYNVLANFVANTTQNADFISQGTMRKSASREMVYSGAGWSMANNVSEIGPQASSTGASGQKMQYTFYGTGFDMRVSGNGTATTWQFTLTDAANPSGTTNLTGAGATTSFYGGNITSFTGSTGTVVFSTSSLAMNGLVVSGLPVGWHTIQFAWVSGTGGMNLNCFDVITPTYSTKSNLYGDIMNTLTVGSNSISDNRQTTPVKDSVPAVKAWAQAFGIQSGPTTTSTSLVPMPDMSVTLKTSGGNIKISYSVDVFNSTAVDHVNVQAYVDGFPVGFVKQGMSATGGAEFVLSDVIRIPVAAGAHKVDLFWLVNAGTGNLVGTERNLLVEEV